ncbi:MAG: FAD-binding oxidoreductase [Acetobacteraceae bacterium]|nr:FAD-binding oxidoreductase [Acetobacteraceae bacterium]
MMGYDLIVIGGGLVGGAIAWGAARLGASVALLDQGDVAFRAARANFGLVWVQSKGAGMPPYAHWSRRSAELWPQLASAMAEGTGIDVGLQQTGGLTFCLGDEEYEQRENFVRRMHNESGNIGTRMISRAEVRAMVPHIGDEVTGAAFCPIDGHANPLYLLRALQQSLQALGGAYFPGRTVDAIAPALHDFSVHSGTEVFTCKKLVIAAGLGSYTLAPMVGLGVPVKPERGQIVITERMKPFLNYATHKLRQTVEGTVMLGDSVEDAGFDTSVRVPVLQNIVQRQVRTFPGLRDATIVRTWAGLRVMSPDGFPIYDQSEKFPGAFAATCHSGVTLAGGHALELAPAIMQGVLPDKFSPFSARRFHVPTH